jgi:hypothetical protein
MGTAKDMNRRIVASLVAAVLLGAGFVLCPPAASAQGNTWAGRSLALLVETARLHWGPLRVNNSLDLANAGYDSDVLYGYFAERLPDVTFSLAAPTQVLALAGKRAVLELYDRPQFVYYAKTASERTFNNTFEGRLHLVLNRFYFQGGFSVDNVRQRLSHELDLNIRQRSNSVNGLVLWQASEDISLALLYRGTRYAYGTIDYQGIDLAAALNRWEDRFDLISYVQPNSRIRLYVDGQYGRHKFTSAGPTSRNTRSYAVLGGFEILSEAPGERARAGLHGDFSLGYKYFDIIDPLLKDSSGLTGRASLSLGLFKRTTARVFFYRDFQFSVYAGTTHYISLNYGGGLNRQISRKITLSYDLLFGKSLYPALDEGLGGLLPSGENQYTNHMASLEVRLRRDLRLTVLGTLSRRVVDTTGLRRTRIFAGFTLSYGVPLGIVSTPVSGLSQ